MSGCQFWYGLSCPKGALGRLADYETVRIGWMVVAQNLLDLKCHVDFLITRNQPQMGTRIILSPRYPTVDSLAHLRRSIGVRGTSVEKDNSTVHGSFVDFRSHCCGFRPNVDGLEQHIPTRGVVDRPCRDGRRLIDLLVLCNILADGHRTCYFILVIVRPREGKADEVGLLRIDGKGVEQETSPSGRTGLVHEMVNV